MIQVFPQLFVGDQDDEAACRDAPGWFVIHACKEPYHRDLLGYTTVGAPVDHPEYLMAHRPGEFFLNLVDVDHQWMIRSEIVEAAVDAIACYLPLGNVLIHCNKGASRSPTIAMLFLARMTDLFAGMDFAEAVAAFREIYPRWAPARGMADFAMHNWPLFCRPKPTLVGEPE